MRRVLAERSTPPSVSSSSSSFLSRFLAAMHGQLVSSILVNRSWSWNASRVKRANEWGHNKDNKKPAVFVASLLRIYDLSCSRAVIYVSIATRPRSRVRWMAIKSTPSLPSPIDDVETISISSLAILIYEWEQVRREIWGSGNNGKCWKHFLGNGGNSGHETIERLCEETWIEATCRFFYRYLRIVLDNLI